MMDLIWFAVVGLIAGFIGGKIMNVDTSNIWQNLVVGIIGAVLGGWLFGLVGIGGGLIVGLIAAIVGAVILLWVVEKFFK